MPTPSPTAPRANEPLSAIFDERFAQGVLPPGWYTDTAFPTYGVGAWDCRGWDGVIVPFPHDAWERLRVEVELSDIGANASAFCGTDARTALTVALGTGPAARHQAAEGGLVLSNVSKPVAIAGGSARVVFEWTRDAMRAGVDGTEVLFAPNLRGSARAGSLQMGFRACIVRRIAAFGEPQRAVPARPSPIQPGYPLEVTVDFNDDLMACAWTHRTFEALFTELKSWGTRRVSWIDLGRAADRYFDFAPLDIGEHGLETMRNVGDIFTAAVEHAHRHGIELVGILKPYDMAIHGISWSPFSEEAKKHGRIHRIGASSCWSTMMAAENQHLIMARKPSAWGPAVNAVWTRLDLVKDDAEPAAITPADVTFIVSDDNETFRPYAGPVTRREVIEDYPVYRSTPSGPVATDQKRRSRVFRFDGLDIREPFFAIQVAGGARSFQNRLCDLVHIFGERGEEPRVTYGISPRRADHATRFNVAPGADSTGPAVGPQGGFEYNRYPGSPTAGLTCGGDAIVTPLALDRGGSSFLAFARGKDRGPLAALSPSFPETRALWMSWITAMLDSGADGIDIRIGHHHADFAWIEYGFEQPVRDEMLRRTGVDIWETDEFDHDLWRRVRGEGWTQFIREAAAVVHGRGKTLAAHIDGHYDSAPGTGGSSNISCDWRPWIEEGLLDRVTGKSLWPESSLSREVLALAHSRGVPVTYAPYCNNFFEEVRSANHLGGSPKGCEVPVERLIRWGRAGGYDGFVLYECASALRARPDGSIGFRPNAEPLRPVLQRHFRGEHA